MENPTKQAEALEPYRDIIQQVAARYGLDPAMVAAKVLTESSARPDVTSSAGARGLMQVQPETAAEMTQKYNLDFPIDGLADPRYNIEVGGAYMAYLRDKFGGNMDKALAGYNAGPTNVFKYRGVPPFPETRKHVARVNERTAQLAALGW